MSLSITILNLLTKLCNIRRRMRWQIRCHNMGEFDKEAIFNIFFYDNYSNDLCGDIAFRQSDESVLYCHFADFPEIKGTISLTDLLLDLINYEKSRTTTETKAYD